MIEIDPQRLMADLRKLATFGAVGTGVYRPAFSEADIAARRWLEARMREAGLEAEIDRYGNVYGRSPAASKAVLIGSHTDSVPKGGWLDGALGVIYGLEIARASLERASGAAVDVISFQDEEGRYMPLLGAKSFCGMLRDDDPALAAIGASRFSTAPARLDPARHRAYLEAHIEQGPKLEAARRRIGVVTGIVGIRRVRVTAHGQADHAGTTPMAMRKDAAAVAKSRTAYRSLLPLTRPSARGAVASVLSCDPSALTRLRPGCTVPLHVLTLAHPARPR